MALAKDELKKMLANDRFPLSGEYDAKWVIETDAGKYLGFVRMIARRKENSA